MKMNRILGTTALVGVLVSFPASAFAQVADSQTSPSDATAAPQQSDGQDTTSGGDIVVTGSRIAAPNLTSTQPITTVSATEIQATANVSVGDVLNDLPQLQSTFSQANSTRFLGTAGLNLLDLYGLGTQRTLVLVNGRRHVGSDILNNAVSPDVNTFPTDLIERVDIITGGDSAIYGSDAVAGVVNFVLKDHYDGLQARAQGSISQYGDAGAYYGSILAGKNFADGRGNIAVDLEYARQNNLYASDRSYLRHADGFVAVDTDPAGLSPGQTNINSDGIPDAIFVRDIRSATISDGGLVSFANPSGACGRDGVPTGAFNNAGRPYTCNFLFRPGGSLIQENGARIGLGTTVSTVTARDPLTGEATTTVVSASSTPTGSYLGGNGNTRREGQLVQILPQLDRYSANLVGHFDISDALVPFIEAKYVRTDSFGTGGSGPAFFTGSTTPSIVATGTTGYERPELNNPFLSADSRAAISAQALALANAGFNPTTGAAFANTYSPNDANGMALPDGQLRLTSTAAQNQAASIASINDGSYRFILRKNLTDLGVRSESARRETYRIVGGIKGDFNTDWHYELSANYGEFKERTTVQGNVNVQRLLLALDAKPNAVGQIVCGSQLDATRGGVDANGNAANLAADIAACQPLNPFGVGSASQAAKNYILQDTTSVGKITQFDVTGFVSGDSSGFFNLPGGPVGFAVGGEYRRETNFFREDPLVSSGYTFYNAIADFTPPSFEVKEAFGELRVPVLKDLPFAADLTLTGSGRVSDYKGSAGTVYTYSGGATYAPIRDIVFRGNYSRAVRAPNLSELFSAQSQNFAPGFIDPCSARNIATGTENRAANCAAAGIPASYDYVYAQSLLISSGGNPDLEAEKSDSYTAGVLLQPRFVPGLSLSVDYYKTVVNNVITAVSAQQIADNCYDSPSLTNPFCSSFQRVAAGGTGPSGEEAYRIIEGSLLQSVLNFAKLRVRGINTTLAYTHTFGGVRLDAKVDYTHQLENVSFTDPSQPDFGDNFLNEVGTPKDAVNLNLNADFGTIFFNYQARYLGKMGLGGAVTPFSEIENHETFEGRPPQNVDDFSPAFFPDVIYMDLRTGINIPGGGNFYVGVDNLTNRRPPLGSTGIGGGTAIYEPVGRRFYAGITAKF